MASSFLVMAPFYLFGLCRRSRVIASRTSATFTLAVHVGRRPLASPPRPCRRPPPMVRHRYLDRAHSFRRLFGQPGLEALVRELLDPGLLVLRGEPADAESLRNRRAGAARGRLPQ